MPEKKIEVVKNNIYTTHKEIVDNEWDYDKNDILPTQLKAGSEKKVWWKCLKDSSHSYNMRINCKIKKQYGCPICSGQGGLYLGINDLETYSKKNNMEYLLEQWDYEKNKKNPNEYHCGSNDVVWWICPISSSHNYEMRINARTGKTKCNCPYCSGNRILKGYNDLETWCRKNNRLDVLKSWDYESNIIKGITINNMGYASGKKVAWICEKRHHYLQTIYSKTGKECGCKICSNKKVLTGYNDLVTWCNQNNRNDILLDWNYEKNSHKPENVVFGASTRTFFKCHICSHEWNTKLSSYSVEGHGCQKCALKTRTSFPEQAIYYYYIKQYFKDAISGDRDKLNRLELDIYIPSLNVGIEYDGAGWHQDEFDKARDTRKDALCKEKNIKLYRIRERSPKSQIYSESDATIYCYKYKNWKELDIIITNILTSLGKCNVDVNIMRDEKNIKNKYFVGKIQNSLKSLYPDIAKGWDYEKNYPLTPEMVAPHSSHKYFWICDKCNNSYEMRVDSRVERKHGCQLCSNRKIIPGHNDLATTNPEILAEWDYEANNAIGIYPTEVSNGSGKRVYWICKKGHKWGAEIKARCRKRTGCKICSDRERTTINHKTSVKCIETDNIYTSIREAERQTNISASNIGSCCRGKSKTAGGYHWTYVL